MPLTSAKWIYPLAILFACLVQGVYPHFSEMDYLHARYARNNFAYNPDERILLSPAPVLIVGEMIFPASPSPILAGFWLGIALAGLIRLLQRENLPILPAFLLLVANPSDIALVALTLLSLELNNRWRSVCLGLMLLVSPLAFIWVMLIYMQGEKLQWGFILLPSGFWWSAAYVYFDSIHPFWSADLPLSLLILLAVGLILGLKFSHSSIFFIWGCAYTLLSPNSLFPVLMCILVFGAVSQQGVKGILVAVLAGILWLERPSIHPQRELDHTPSIGYLGSFQEAFFYTGAVYELSGRDHPDWRGLSQAEIILATAPQKLVLDNLPVLALVYENKGAFWEREVSVAPWENKQKLDLSLGRDIRLMSLTQTGLGDVLRLKLDWQLSALPEHPLVVNLQALDFQQVSYGFSEQAIPPEKWTNGGGSSYHALPLSSDIPVGGYQVQLTLGYEGGLIDQQRITHFKVPLNFIPADLPDQKLMEFSGEGQAAILWQIRTTATETSLYIEALWQSQSRFQANYTVFFHLTSPDDPTPLVQADISPLDGRYPSSLWEAGEWIPVSAQLDQLPAGDYLLRVGLFNPERGRLGTSYDLALSLP